MNPTKYAGHTKGPWWLRGSEIAGLPPHRWLLEGGFGHRVSGRHIAYFPKLVDEFQSEQAANATLIAAAPQLLAENQRLIEALKSLGPRNCGFGESFSWPDYLDAWKKACALLAELEVDK